jgi:hypothetical protein
MKAKLQKELKLADGKKVPQKYFLNSLVPFFSKIIYLAIEVWTDVLGFIKRIQLVRSVSLTNRHIHGICWPRLHGNNVIAHKIPLITIVSRERCDQGLPPTALLLKDGKGVPIPKCPPPAYISGIVQIGVK